MKKICLIFCLLVSLHAFAQDTGRVPAMTQPLAVMGNITQPFGESTNFMTFEPWFHDGIDILTPMRTPVLAAMTGVVSEAGEHRSLGNYMILDHGNGYKTMYGQLDEIVAVKGRRVTQGETIAFSGNTGLSTGPHLHFGVYLEEKAVDPLPVLKGDW
jgi:murein DD-endopeptidase MepM/ murein hydrolase activator NlpD